MRKTITVSSDDASKWVQVPFREGYIAGAQATVEPGVDAIVFVDPDGNVLTDRRRNTWRDA